MHVIKESYETIARRQQLKSQKQNILDMEFTNSRSHDWNKLNKFVNDRASERISNFETQIDSPCSKKLPS